MENIPQVNWENNKATNHHDKWYNIVEQSKNSLIKVLIRKKKLKISSEQISLMLENNTFSFLFVETCDKVFLVSACIGKSNCKIHFEKSSFQVSDMHAEMLNLRVLEYSLVELAVAHSNNLKSNDLSILKERKSGPKFELKKSVKIWIYVSKYPCGDCSIEKNNGSNENHKYPKTWPIDFLKQCEENQKSCIKDLIKSQEEVNQKRILQKGILRSKPFRKDLPVDKMAHELSCSDKLMFASILGINSNLLNCLFEPIYIDSLLLHEKVQHKHETVEMGLSFKKRYLLGTRPENFVKFDNDTNKVILGAKASKKYKISEIKVKILKQKSGTQMNQISRSGFPKILNNLVFIQRFEQPFFQLCDFYQELDPKTGFLKGAGLKKRNINWSKISCRLSSFHVKKLIASSAKLKKMLEKKMKIFESQNEEQMLYDLCEKNLSIRSTLISNQMNNIIFLNDNLLFFSVLL